MIVAALASAGAWWSVIGDWSAVALVVVALAVAGAPELARVVGRRVDAVSLGWLEVDLDDEDEGGCG